MLAALASSGQAQTESVHPYLDRKHTFLAGMYFQDAKAEVSARVDPFPRQTIGLGALGVSESDDSWYLEYRYRINERWGLAAAGHSFSSRGTRGNIRSFNFAGVEFPVGAELRSELSVDTYFIDAIYNVFRSPQTEISVGLGLHAFDFEMEIKGEARAGPTLFTESEAADDLLAPLPNLRLQLFHAFDSRWSIGASGGWVSANIDEWDGKFLFLHGRAAYRITEHLGLSVGYQFLDVDVTRSQPRKRQEYDIEFEGPTVTFTATF